MSSDSPSATVRHSLSDRMESFRQASRRRGDNPPETPRHDNFADAFLGRYAELPFPERYARSLAYAFENEPVYLLDDERIVGMLYQTGNRQPSEHVAERMAPFRHDTHRDSAQQHLDPHVDAKASPGHVGWWWDRILAGGIEGLLETLERKLDDAPDQPAREFFSGAMVLWQAVLRWNDKHVDALREALNTCHDPMERTRLAELIERCTRVPRHGARTFAEAVQAFWVQHLAVMFENPYGGNGPGRVDLFLWPYLEADLAAGRTTHDEAQELIDELLVRLHERIQMSDYWVEAVMVGGSHRDGRSSVNPLSKMLVESFMALDQSHPSTYMRLRDDDPEWFTELAVDYLIGGGNRAQMYNERVVIEALGRQGVPPEDARMYMAGGCMEISCQGLAADMVFCNKVNVAKTLELVLGGGVDMLTGETVSPVETTLADYPTFEALMEAFAAEVRRYLTVMNEGFDISSRMFAQWRPCYLLSSLVDECIERGREQQDGGARYNDYGFSFLGVTSAADSLNAIKRAVYDEGFVSADKLLEALRSDYRDNEPLRQRLAALPRYGSGDAAADAMADRVMTLVCETATSIENRHGGRLKPMFFNFVWTPAESARLGARADGLSAGHTIGHGMTPQSAGMTEGLTQAVNSAVKLNCACVPGGVTTMWDLDPKLARPEVVKAVLLRFMQGGGMIFQGNMTDPSELERAIDNPQDYPSLIVRVGGFSARFVTLSPQVQREVARRYRHGG